MKQREVPALLLALVLATGSAAGDALQFGAAGRAGAVAGQSLAFRPAPRVAPFNSGAPGMDYQGTVAPRVNGFAAYWLHAGVLWSEPVSGSPPRPDTFSARPLDISATGVAETVNGPIVLYTDGHATFVRALNAPGSAATLVSPGDPDAIECNATRCLVSVDGGNILAIVDADAQLVKLFPPNAFANYRNAWAADPNGF